MSWIFGFYSKRSNIDKSIKYCHPNPIAVISEPNYYLSIGGNKNTSYIETERPDSKFLICGFAISEDAAKIVSKNDWNQILNGSPNELNSLNGHFCGIFIKNNSLNLFTDKLGLREFHIYETNIGWYFSTRLDWLLKLNRFEMNFGEFGSRWLLINQLSNQSIVKSIYRLNCGEKIIFNNNQSVVESINWVPSKGKSITDEEYKSKLKNLILTGFKRSSKISLSLSGGMDSRVILSFLLNANHTNWDCHTFLTDSKMDLRIAERIAKDLEVKHKVYSLDELSTSAIIDNLFEYIGITYLTESGFTSQKLTHYKFFSEDELIIDGGFGEIWRREFLTRLFFYGKKDLENENHPSTVKYLLNNRADIFTENYSGLMMNGCIEQIDHISRSLPSINEIGIGNWLDLFSLKTRLVNYYAQEQSRIDNYVMSYMPFIQPSLIKDLLNVPITKRKNSRLFKNIIQSNSGRLSKYSLAKGNMSYPFYFTPLLKRVYSILYGKFVGNKAKNELDLYLLTIKDFVFDSILSTSAKNYAPYNYPRILKGIESYYKGDTSNNTFVDWFISFEIFRQILESEPNSALIENGID